MRVRISQPTPALALPVKSASSVSVNQGRLP